MSKTRRTQRDPQHSPAHRRLRQALREMEERREPSTASAPLHQSLKSGTDPARALARWDTQRRTAATTHLQQTAGNRAVQRMLDPRAMDMHTTDEPVASRQEEEEEVQGFLGNVGGVLDLSKNLMGLGGEGSLMDDMPGLGIGMDVFGEMLGRGSRGEGTGEAIGGGLTKGLTSTLLEQEEVSDALGEFGPESGSLRSGASSGLGLLGSGLKMAGGIMGEQPGSEFGLTDYGEYADVLGKAINPQELATQGIQEGMMNWYNLAQAGADYAATGQTTALEEMGEEQLKGGVGPITQGYSMIANLIGSGAIGDYSEMYRISDMAGEGELGALPKLGDWLGDEWYDILNRPGGFGASMGEIGNFIWEGTGEGGIRGAATGAAEWISDLF